VGDRILTSKYSNYIRLSDGSSWQKIKALEQQVKDLSGKVEALEDILDRYEKEKAFERKWGKAYDEYF
jgi:outer membrane murein-binding lipoprotein Lpp